MTGIIGNNPEVGDVVDFEDPSESTTFRGKVIYRKEDLIKVQSGDHKYTKNVSEVRIIHKKPH